MDVIEADISAVVRHRTAFDRHAGRRYRHSDAAGRNRERIASGVDVDTIGSHVNFGAIVVVDRHVTGGPAFWATATIAERNNDRVRSVAADKTNYGFGGSIAATCSGNRGKAVALKVLDVGKAFVLQANKVERSQLAAILDGLYASACNRHKNPA